MPALVFSPMESVSVTFFLFSDSSLYGPGVLTIYTNHPGEDPVPPEQGPPRWCVHRVHSGPRSGFREHASPGNISLNFCVSWNG